MTEVAALPDEFLVRLHDDVVVGGLLTRGVRVMKLSATGRALLGDRELAVTSPVTAALAARLLDLDLAVPVLPERGPRWLDDVTVVVPVRDRAAGVDRLLAELAPSVRCVVVDDASLDAASLAAVARRHGAQLVRLDRNRGPAAARNAGLREVTTAWVAFVDSDVTLAVADLRRLLAHFADPGLAAVAPRVRSRGGRRWFERYEDAHGALDLGATSATVRQWSPVSYVPTACLVVRVSALGAGFDERLVSGEDVDLVWTLVDGGSRVRHAAEIDAWHEGRTSVRSWLGRKAFYGSSAAPLARRHGARVAPAVFTPSSASVVSLLAVPTRWLAPASAVVAARLLGSVSADLPDADARTRARVAVSSVAVTGRQTTDLALRHWWPATLVLACASRRARRLVAGAALADGVLTWARADTTLDPVRFTAARRLDDLAYGAGVWWGAARDRSVRCLLPHWIRPGRAGR
ncbi:MAG: mycofactocin biosynthesis glycosyltransferase MftF [Aeromicrobium sp.]